MKTLKLCCAIALSVGIGLSTLSARADFVPTGDPVPLKTLLEGGQLTSCDKVFTNWTFSAIGGASSLTFSIIPGYDEFGPGFRIISDELYANTNQLKDVLIGFKVTSNGPKITDVHLRMGSQVAGNGNTNVVEQVKNGSGSILGQLVVYNPPPVLEETLYLANPQSLLFVTKDIFMLGGNSTNPGASTITFVDQTFSQEGTIECSINGPETVCGGSSNHQFSGPAGASTYSWSITGNGTIVGSTTGQNINVTAGTSGSFTVQLTVLNGACQFSSCERTVTITENPVCDIGGTSPDCATTSREHTAPAGMTLYAWSISGDATITGATNQQTVTVQPTGTCSGSYTLYLTISNGCSSTCQKTFNYGDTTKPQITSCPQGGDLGCNPTTLPTCDSVKAQVTATDNCGTYTLECLPASSVSGCNVELSFTIRAVDPCGNKSDPCIVTYTYKTDTEKPVITSCPEGGYLGCNPETLPDCDSVKAQVTASDACGTYTLHCKMSETQEGCIYTRTFTIKAVDGCGNKSDPCIVRYTYKVDTTKPEITSCPEGGYLGCNPTTLPDCDSVKAQVTASDNCGSYTLHCTVENSQDGCTYTRKFTIVAKDECGKESDPCVVTYTWSVAAGNGISVQCAPDITVNRLADVPECDVNTVTVLNNCGTPTVQCEKGPLVGTACNGSITFTYTARDNCGTASCTRVVRIVQEVPCSISGPEKLCATGSNTCGSYNGPENDGSYTYQWSIVGNGTINGSTTERTVEACATGAGSFTLTLVVTNPDGCQSRCTKVVITENCGDFEGCSPGFWKNHPGLWDGNAPDAPGVTYKTTDKYNTVFGVTAAQSGFPDTASLLDVIGTGGGCKFALGRHAVAALLNSQANNYPLTTAQVLAQVKAALLTNDCAQIDSLKDTLDEYNNLEGGVCGKDEPRCTISPSIATICAGTSQVLTVNVTGGSAPFTYLWSTGATSASITVSDPGEYSVVVTDKHGDSTDCAAKVFIKDCEPPCVLKCETTTFNFSGSSPLSGTAGNVRVFTVNGVSVKATAFSRTKGATGSWATAYLGLYSGGLGVTDTSEGDGSSNKHTVDNIGRDNFVLFEFSEEVIVERVCVGYVVKDSDMSIWIGKFTDPYNNHLNLSDAVLGNFAHSEINLTGSSLTRCADINAAQFVGNALIVAAWTEDDTPEDQFKINKLVVCKRVCVPDCVKPSCGINGPEKVCKGSATVTYCAPEGAQSYKWTVSGNAIITSGTNSRCVTVKPGDCGSFTLCLTASNGGDCKTTCKKTVYVVDKPYFSLNAPNPLPVCGSTDNKLVGPSGYATYNWTIAGNGWTITAGANSQTVTYKAGSGTGTLTLCVTNAAGCSMCKSVSFSCRAPYTGCTPGFWKNHPALWNGISPDLPGITYKTTDKFNAVFGVTAAQSGFSDSTTLLTVLGTGGGCKNALGRHAVAALLNTKANNYPLTTAQVLSQVKSALLTNNCTTIENLKNTLDAYNNFGGGVCDNPPKDCK
jgi:hypothetical protein